MQMAHPSSLNYVVIFLLLPALAISSNPPQHKKLKSIHFTAYMHDTIAKTDFLIYPGIAGKNFTATVAPFGSMYVLKDPLTVSPDPKSKVIGTGESFTITSTMDGLNSITVSKLTLNVQGHKGSISTVGVQSNYKPSDTPVSGGTGDFLFVQGYVTSSLFIPFKAGGELTNVYKFECHLFWPPYAAYY